MIPVHLPDSSWMKVSRMKLVACISLLINLVFAFTVLDVRIVPLVSKSAAYVQGNPDGVSLVWCKCGMFSMSKSVGILTIPSQRQ